MPLALMSQRTSVLVVNPAFPAKTFSEYLAFAKASPGKINYGTPFVAGIGHFAAAWLHSATGTKVTLVHYKGAAPMNLDLVAGRLDATMTTLQSALPHIKSGKLRLLAVASGQRTKVLPGTPTIAELGVTGYDYANWTGY